MEISNEDIERIAKRTADLVSGMGSGMKMKLWRENRLDQEWESTFEEIYQGFKNSEWYDVPYPLERKLSLYMTDSKYLNSTFERDDFHKLVDYIIRRRE